jgi:hypothetical protein
MVYVLRKSIGGLHLLRLRLPHPLLAVLLGAALALFAVTPAFAYGSNDTWQIGFSGTGVAPGTGQGFGFWGWCAFAGVTSGTDGDCQLAQYVHGPAGSGFTCHESINVTAWDTSSGGTFVIEAATVTVNPSSLTGACLSFFPGPAGFPVDTGFPAAPGHYNFGSLGPGLRGSFQVQVTEIPH